VVDTHQPTDVLYVVDKPTDKSVDVMLGHACLTEHGLEVLREHLQPSQVLLTDTFHDRVPVPITNGDVERLNDRHREVLRVLNKGWDSIGNGIQVAEGKEVIDPIVEVACTRRLMCEVGWKGEVDGAPNLAGKEKATGTEQPSHFLEERWVISNSEIDITSMDKVHRPVSPPETLCDIVDFELDIWLGLPSRNRNYINPIDLYIGKCSCHIHWPIACPCAQIEDTFLPAVEDLGYRPHVVELDGIMQDMVKIFQPSLLVCIYRQWIR